MQDQLSLSEGGHPGGESWTAGPDARQVSARGVVIGALIGLASGLALNYMVLLAASVLRLPWGGEPWGDSWFVPVLLAATVLGVVYYGRED